MRNKSSVMKGRVPSIFRDTHSGESNKNKLEMKRIYLSDDIRIAFPGLFSPFFDDECSNISSSIENSPSVCVDETVNNCLDG